MTFVILGNFYLNQPKRFELKDDPLCGITTGGREDCFWDCEIEVFGNGPIVSNPECLLDCFPEVIFLSSHNLESNSNFRNPALILF